jgi:hypothetical protein
MSDRELDVLVAEKVFGLVPCTAACHDFGNMRPCHAQPDSPDQGAETRCYSTRIEDAWMVVEAMREQGYCFYLETDQDGEAFAMFGDDLNGAEAPTAPRVICLAALATLPAPCPPAEGEKDV